MCLIQLLNNFPSLFPHGKVDSGLSTVLRKMDTTVISSYGTNGRCQQTAAEGPFSGDKIICSDGSQFRRYCYVIY